MVARHRVVLFLALMKQAAHHRFIFVGRAECR